MWRIGLYSTPISGLLQYRGIYRSADLDIDATTPRLLRNEIEWFYQNSVDGTYLLRTPKNETKLKALYVMLKQSQWQGDLISFCLQVSVANECVESKLLGYDICADSMYYSPLGDGVMRSYDNTMFFKDMSQIDYKIYRHHINSAWLFDSYAIAEQFANYCRHINRKFSGCIESEDAWRPVAIFRWSPRCNHHNLNPALG